MTAISTTPATSMSATTANRGRFVWHELMTTDLDAARDFYTKVIGWTTQKWDGNKDYTMWLAGKRPVGGLMTLPAEAAAMGAPPSWLAYIEVPDIDATVAKANELGGTILQPVMDIDQVGRIALHGVERLLPVGGFTDVEVADLAQPVDEDAAVVLVVFHHQNLLRHGPHPFLDRPLRLRVWRGELRVSITQACAKPCTRRQFDTLRAPCA